ncbi:hypothetical protein NL676_001818 [Syzygium grande]|nr:hypothetical protein NL676_001818 [Syzygium grande]
MRERWKARIELTTDAKILSSNACSAVPLSFSDLLPLDLEPSYRPPLLEEASTLLNSIILATFVSARAKSVLSGGGGGGGGGRRPSLAAVAGPQKAAPPQYIHSTWPSHPRFRLLLDLC